MSCTSRPRSNRTVACRKLPCSSCAMRNRAVRVSSSRSALFGNLGDAFTGGRVLLRKKLDLMPQTGQRCLEIVGDVIAHRPNPCHEALKPVEHVIYAGTEAIKVISIRAAGHPSLEVPQPNAVDSAVQCLANGGGCDTPENRQPGLTLGRSVQSHHQPHPVPAAAHQRPLTRRRRAEPPSARRSERPGPNSRWVCFAGVRSGKPETLDRRGFQRRALLQTRCS